LKVSGVLLPMVSTTAACRGPLPLLSLLPPLLLLLLPPPPPSCSALSRSLSRASNSSCSWLKRCASSGECRASSTVVRSLGSFFSMPFTRAFSAGE
jgi:hypothetical protein